MTKTDKEEERRAAELRRLKRERQRLEKLLLQQQAQHHPPIDYSEAFWNDVDESQLSSYKTLLRNEIDEFRDILDGDSNIITYVTFGERYEFITEHSFHTITGWLSTYVIDFFILLWESMRPVQTFQQDIIVLSTFWYQAQSSYFDQHNDIYQDSYTNLYKKPNTPYYGKHLKDSSIILFVVYAPSHWYLVIINIKDKTVHNMNGFQTLSGQRRSFETVLSKWWKREHSSCNIRKCDRLKFYYHDKYGKEPNNDIQQTDFTSCGVSVIMHAYYQIVENRIATMKDFSFSQMPTIRNYLGITMYTLGYQTGVMMRKYSYIEPIMIEESNEKSVSFI